MRQYLFVTIPLALFGILKAQPNDVRILNEDSRSLTVEFTPRFSREAAGNQSGATVTAFEGATPEMDKERSTGLYRGLPVVLPSTRFVLSILGAEYQEVKTPEQTKFGKRNSPLVKLTDVNRTRGLYVGVLKFFPLQADGNGAGKVYARIVARIEFDPWPDGSMKASMLMKGNIPPPAASRASIGNPPDSPLAQGIWYRLEVRETGMYKLDQQFFNQAGISLSSIGSMSSIRIFGNGGRELAEDLAATRPNGLEEVTRHVVDNNGNGLFDPGDFVVFYGKSPRGWAYDPNQKTFSHYLHHYTESNYYFMTFGGMNGRPMDSLSSTSLGGPFKPADFQEKLFVEQEQFKILPTGSGREWVGQQFNIVDNTGLYSNSLPGYDPSKPVLYKFVFVSRSASYDAFSVYENNQQIGTPVLMFPTQLNDESADYAYRTPAVSVLRTAGIPSNQSVLKLVFGTANQAAVGWLDWFEIQYRRLFQADKDVLLFSSPDTTATVEYTVRSLSSGDIMVFDVSDHRSVKRITQLQFDAVNALKFQVADTAGNVHEFAVVGPTGFKTPLSTARIQNSNLHGISPGADLVIISPSDFLSEAARLRAYREQRDSLKGVVVNVDDIFSEFSSGQKDPVAIRDFLKYAQVSWTLKPRYVLLFGDGHYDYKNVTTSAKNWILPYETVESINPIYSYATDDFFVMLDVGSPRISIPIGRIPARTLQEASTYVDKIIAYETNGVFDPWRNRITFVADDGLTSTGDDGDIHTAQTEQLAENYTPASFEKKKIYIVEYPTILSATGRRKPDANRDIVAAINQGTVIINYVGHGNPQLWAHEAIFTREGDIVQLTNKDRLTFVVAATCNYAHYDNPAEESSGELLMLMNQGGAIGVVTASRVVYSDQNAYFNYTLYSHLFQRDPQGNIPRMGDVMWLTKQSLFSVNDAKYHLFCDPTMRLTIPRVKATVDSVNGASTQQLVAMKSLGHVVVKGTVRRADNSPWTTFSGLGILEVFDSKRSVFVSEWGESFSFTGSLLYRGEISITNGSYQATLPIPKDVSYGSSSRISLYAWNESTDAVGYTDSVTIRGTDTTAAPDTTGPRISIHLDDPSFRSGDVVKSDPVLIVDLSDQNGINTSAAGIGHRLEARLSSQSQPIDLTQFYRSNLDTYQSGQVRYQFSGLPEGKQTLTVKAWDTYNNSAQAETFFDVRTTENLALYNVANFPNPFSRSTLFTFQRNAFDPIDIQIKIYTLTGRLIQQIDALAVADRFVQIPWDGRDHDGNELANGVYFYKVIARTPDRSSSTEVIEKLAIIR